MFSFVDVLTHCFVFNQQVTKVDRLRQTPSDLTGNELDFNFKRKKKNQKTRPIETQEKIFFEEEYDEMEEDIYMD